MDSEIKNEIWSEYFRVKNELMDYDKNFRESLGNIRMLLNMGYTPKRCMQHFGKAQKLVGYILDLGLKCGAIPDTADKEKLNKMQQIATGEQIDIKSLENVQIWFRDWCIETRFYNVAISIDNRPAMVRKK